MARTAKKNDRCPFKDTCEQKCEWKNKEIECDYYRNNSCPGKEIADQEELREQYTAEHYKVGSGTDEVYAVALTPDTLEATDRNGIVYLPIDKLIPHKNNPRKELGDLTELADSIKVKGVLQNLTVVPDKKNPDQYIIVIGHRRCAAAKIAGLTELPCAIVDMDDKEQIETMLLENIQRKELTTADEIFGYQMMFDLGATVDEIAESTGFSKSTIRKRKDYGKMDPEKLKKACEKQISFAELDKLSKIEDSAVRDELLGKYGSSDYNWSYERALRAQGYEKQGRDWVNFFIEHESYNMTQISMEEHNANHQKYESIGALCGKPDEKNVEEWETEHHWVLTNPTYFYIDLDYSCVIRLYKEAAPKTAEEQAREKAAEERKKLFDERRNEIEEIAKTAFECRKRAIEECPVHIISENREQILRMMPEILMSGHYCNFDECRFLDALRVKYKKPKNSWDNVEYDTVSADLDRKNADKLLLAFVYGLIRDSEKQKYYDYSCRVWQNEILDHAYKLLDIIGYEMSDEEKRFVNGELAIASEEGEEKDEEDDEEWGEDE